MLKVTLGLMAAVVMGFCSYAVSATEPGDGEGDTRIERLKRSIEKQLQEQLPEGARVRVRVTEKEAPADAEEGKQKEGKDKKPARRRDIAAGFKQADADSDGKVSKKELSEYIGKKLPDFDKSDELFKKLDKDEDDALSKKEFGNRFKVLAEMLGKNFRPAPRPDAKKPEGDKKPAGGFDGLRKQLKAKGMPDAAIDQVIEQLKARGLKELPKGARIEVRGLDGKPKDKRPET